MSRANAVLRSLRNTGSVIPFDEQVNYTLTNPVADNRVIDPITITLQELAEVQHTLLRDLDHTLQTT